MSGRQRIISVDGRQFRLVATVDEGLRLNFIAGRAIAIEKFDMRPGGTEFDFQVNSRAVHGGRPIDIVSTKSALDREFIENRVKTNVAGLPISLGNVAAIARGKAPAELTYGEVQPQVFRSNAGTPTVGWRIVFTRAHYSGAGGKAPVRATTRPGGRIPTGITLRPPTGEARRAEAGRATTMGNASASAGAHSEGPRPGHADGRVNPLGTGATLRVYVEMGQPYRPLARPIGSGDMIGTDPSLVDRVMGWFR